MSTRSLLLTEQREVQRSERPFAAVFDSAYPELKADLQHVMLACERRDLFGMNLLSFHQELVIHMAEALRGTRYSSFNCLAEYDQDLAALGFPDLLAFLRDKDFEGLRRACESFDQHLQGYLREHSVALNAFSSVEELQRHLAGG